MTMHSHPPPTGWGAYGSDPLSASQTDGSSGSCVAPQNAIKLNGTYREESQSRSDGSTWQEDDTHALLASDTLTRGRRSSPLSRSLLVSSRLSFKSYSLVLFGGMVNLCCW